MKNSNVENINDYNITALNDAEEYILSVENKDEILKIIQSYVQGEYIY